MMEKITNGLEEFLGEATIAKRGIIEDKKNEPDSQEYFLSEEFKTYSREMQTLLIGKPIRRII